MNSYSRRHFLNHAGTAGLALAASAITPRSLAASKKPQFTSGKKPNIVFILADDWGWGDLGCYGHNVLRTPRLDQLAREGMIFNQFYVSAPVCSPSRAGIMTGRFPSRMKIFAHIANPKRNRERGMPDYLDPEITTITDLFKANGYRTGHFGKWHLGNSPKAPGPEKYGIEDFRGIVANGPGWEDEKNFIPRSTELIVDETIRFIQDNKNEPFYVNVWLKDTHAVLAPTEEQMKPYKKMGGAMSVYYGAATDADRHLGRLFDQLDEMGLDENTIVIFSSDNGPEDIHIRNASHSGIGSAGPLRGRKRSLYEGGIRTPFIIRWPGKVPAGTVNADTVLSGVDMLPTLCAVAGIDVPEELDLDGENLSEAFLDTSVERSTPLMWDFRYLIVGHPFHKSPILALRDGRWKLLMNPDGSRVELYDIETDPREMNDLAFEHPRRTRRLSKKLMAWYHELPEAEIQKGAGSDAYRWPQPVGN